MWTATTGHGPPTSTARPGQNAGWNGRTSGGALLHGSVTTSVTLDRDDATYRFDYPYAAGVAAHPAAGLAGSTPGLNTFLTTIDTNRRDRVESLATKAEQARVQVLRESFDWHRVEPRRGYFEWAKFDQAVEVAAAHNLAILGRLQYSAGWASSAPASVTGTARYYYPPDDPDDFAAYAAAVVERYKDRVHVWEIWNEPNEANLWRPSPSPSGYAAVLKAAYGAIKAVDPDAIVVSGGLSTRPDQAFLDGLEAAGAWDDFDVLGIHAFVNDNPSSSTSMFPVWLDWPRRRSRPRGPSPSGSRSGDGRRTRTACPRRRRRRTSRTGSAWRRRRDRAGSCCTSSRTTAATPVASSTTSGSSPPPGVTSPHSTS